MRYFAIVLTIAASVGIYFATTPKPAQCASGLCVQGGCFDSSQCVGDCVCIREGAKQGRCVSIN